MIINPVIILFLLYLLANTYAFLLLLNNGGFSDFGRFFKIETEVAIWTYVLQLFFLLILLFPYGTYSKSKFYKRELDNKYGYFLLFITVSFFVFNQITGAGRAGSGFSFNGGSSLNIIFVLLQPDLLFFLIAPFLRSRRLFNIIAVVYFLSLLSRGWMGAVLLLMVVWLVRYYPVRIGTRNSFYFSLSGIITILALPFLDGLKSGMRNSRPFIDIISQVLDKDYFETLNVVLESVVSRLQNINYASYV